MEKEIAAFYATKTLIKQIESGLAKMGLSSKTVSQEDLSPIDEFHIGGRQATKQFFSQIPHLHVGQVLDIGCGVGGPARFISTLLDCDVMGLDLSSDYIKAGNILSKWVGLSERVHLQQGSATNMPFAPERFDAAYMMHVGMNIADKETLMENAFRVLRPGGYFAIYDVMKVGDATTTYPLPWAEAEQMDASTTPELYRKALIKAGFTLERETDRSEMAISFFDKVADADNRAKTLPPIGLNLLMGPSASQKVGNVARQIRNGLFAPIEMIAKKPS